MKIWVLVDSAGCQYTVKAYPTHERARKAFIDYLREGTRDECTNVGWVDDDDRTYKDCIEEECCCLSCYVCIEEVELEE